MVIGDSAAHIEVIVQGALMCGYHAGRVIVKELNEEDDLLNTPVGGTKNLTLIEWTVFRLLNYMGH